MDYVRSENPDLVIFGGDITDEASYASIEYAEKEIGKEGNPEDPQNQLGLELPFLIEAHLATSVSSSGG